MQSGRWMAIPFLAVAVLVVSAGSVPRQVVGFDVASFADRDVLVLRTSGGVPVPSVYTRDKASATIEFLLRGVGADDLSAAAVSTKLIADVELDASAPDGVTVRVSLFTPELVDPQCLRFSQPSEHVILLEVFPIPGVKDDASLILDIEGQLGLGGQPSLDSAATPEPAADDPPQSPTTDLAGIPTVDLRDADPARVLGLAADTGLLNMKGRAQVATENWGELLVQPAGQSLASWTQETPPSELYLSGTADQLAKFLRQAESSQLASQPTLAEFWAANRPPYRTRTSLAGIGSASSGMRDDPYAGLYYADSVPGAGPLSDVRVTLPAMDGMNLYDVLHYLSLISGISLIIDPYAFDEPFGSRRAPLPPEQAETDEGGPGYRPASVFDPQLGRSGTVMGNFDNVPFDTALKLILDMHELEFVVYGGDSGSGAMRYGKPAASRRPGDPQGSFEKPVILITSRERLEQELTGANQIDLYQFHYADPYVVTDILANFSLLPGTNSGWYIYGGTGLGRFGGGGGGGTGGSGTGGGGGSGGGASGSGSGRGGTAAVPDVVTYRGSSRQPVLDAVQAAFGAGHDVIRVLLAPEENGFLVTTLGG